MATISTRPKSPPRVESIAKAMRPGPVYNTGVLLGNWVEDRIECPRAGSLYFPPKDDVDYIELKPESRQKDFRLNKLNNTQVPGGSLSVCDPMNGNIMVPLSPNSQ